MKTGYFALLAGALSLAGCVIETAGPLRHDFRSFERDNSEEVRVNLNMGAGNLQVGTGTGKLVSADFAYNVPSWKPDVRYHSIAGRGSLTIEQPGQTHTHMGGQKYEWDVRFSRDVPLRMNVHFGAGEARLDLGNLSLRSVDVEMGVGQLQMDLRGNPTHDYDVHIRGGIGEATVRLPSGVGVIADAEGGIGEIKTSGLRREGHRWVNESYERSKVTIHLDVRGGIGAIHLISD